MIAGLWLLIALVAVVLVAKHIYCSKLSTNITTEIWLMLAVLFMSLVAFLWFIQDIISIFINGLILYLLFLRVSAEVSKKKKSREVTLIAFLLSLAIVLLAGNPLPVWSITTACLLAFMLTQSYFWLKKSQHR